LKFTKRRQLFILGGEGVRVSNILSKFFFSVSSRFYLVTKEVPLICHKIGHDHFSEMHVTSLITNHFIISCHYRIEWKTVSVLTIFWYPVLIIYQFTSHCPHYIAVPRNASARLSQFIIVEHGRIKQLKKSRTFPRH
jgi:hypothetical protein